MASYPVSLKKLTEALQASWGPDTSVAGNALPVDNHARGQCVVSSLVVQDFFGGDLVRVAVSGDGINEKHYYNVLDDGTVIDTTVDQYQSRPLTFTVVPVDLKGKYASIRAKLLHDDETSEQYSILKRKVQDFLSRD